MDNFIYFGSAKISTVVDDYTTRVVEAGDKWERVSSTLIPSSLQTIGQLTLARKQLVANACAVSF